MSKGFKTIPKALRDKKRYVLYKEGEERFDLKIKELFGEFGLAEAEAKEIKKGVIKCNLKGLNIVGTAIMLSKGEIIGVFGTLSALERARDKNK